ncbi:Alpha-aminoadipic semialdehyde synthase [Vitis vinifera]|uniref:Alpha-aminoadipic semialdehyde synthase n=1 Tax=Vitis vinifera TaxID=29760 RepID=A0A438CZK0_VITVI|nr:Alpha-aminoadipic semialdehyde synthase [Vitis vinifera]
MLEKEYLLDVVGGKDVAPLPHSKLFEQGCVTVMIDFLIIAQVHRMLSSIDHFLHHVTRLRSKSSTVIAIILFVLIILVIIFRYDPFNDSYHHDMEGKGVICASVDILPTEFAKEASKHFGDILSEFIGSLASTTDITELPAHLRRSCIAHGGAVTTLFEYIPRMRNSDSEKLPETLANCHSNKKYNILVSLSGHLFDQFLINEALDIIEAAGGSFHLVKCQVGQSANAMSYSELEVSKPSAQFYSERKNVAMKVVDFNVKWTPLPKGNLKYAKWTPLPKGNLKYAKWTPLPKGNLNSTLMVVPSVSTEPYTVLSFLDSLLPTVGPSNCFEQVGADDNAVLHQIIDSLMSLANPSENDGFLSKETNKISLKVGKVLERGNMMELDDKEKPGVLILGAGRVCQPVAEVLTTAGSVSSRQLFKMCQESDFEGQSDIQVIVASLYLKDAEEIIEGLPNATAIQLDVMDHENLHKYISQVEVVISLLPASCHFIVANACIELKKHLVTASYIDDSMSKLDERAKGAGITILGEMGLDPGIVGPTLLNQKEFDWLTWCFCESHDGNDDDRPGTCPRRENKVFHFLLWGLPSPEAANNPLAYKFSWNPAGAIRSGRNPATYRSHGETVSINGESLYDSAVSFRIPDLPAFALEILPNRNSLVYGDLYGIDHEASTIFRGTLRYEGMTYLWILYGTYPLIFCLGFAEIMGTLARVGFFDTEAHPILTLTKRPTFGAFLLELLKIKSEDFDGTMTEEDVKERILALGLCKVQVTALKTAKTILYLGFHEQTEIPVSCRSAFDVACLRMEERLAYSSEEQDMVLLHHEVEVEFPDGRPVEKHRATLLEFGKTKNGKTTTAMAFTVGIPVAIGALLILEKKIKTRGVLRPIEPQVYVPALDILQAYGLKLLEKTE